MKFRKPQKSAEPNKEIYKNGEIMIKRGATLRVPRFSSFTFFAFCLAGLFATATAAEETAALFAAAANKHKSHRQAIATVKQTV